MSVAALKALIRISALGNFQNDGRSCNDSQCAAPFSKRPCYLFLPPMGKCFWEWSVSTAWLAYSVKGTQSEIGIRLALGASRSQVSACS